MRPLMPGTKGVQGFVTFSWGVLRGFKDKGLGSKFLKGSYVGVYIGESKDPNSKVLGPKYH